jgi:hypothetical protein
MHAPSRHRSAEHPPKPLFYLDFNSTVFVEYSAGAKLRNLIFARRAEHDQFEAWKNPKTPPSDCTR